MNHPVLKKCVLAMSLALAAALTAGEAAAQALAEPVVVRAWFDDEAAIGKVQHLLGHAQVDRAKGLLRLEADADLRAALQAAGFRLETDGEATLAVHRLLAAERAGLHSIPSYACYRTVEETEATMQDLAAAYPNLAEIIDIGPSWQALDGVGGYRLQVLRVTNRALGTSKPKMFIMASVHAREYAPAELATRFVESLLHDYGRDADATWLLDHHEVHALLQANPDGRKKAETGLSWRKNHNTTHCGGGNNAGIDLNRNFPFEWGNWGGSSPSACAETFRGPSAMSEPETSAIVNYLRSIYPDRRGPGFGDPADPDTQGVFFDIHSYSELVLWPWGFNSSLPANIDALRALGRRLAWFNDYTPQQAVGLYPTDGTTDDFAYGDLGVPAYTFEVGTAFFQSCASFENRVDPDNRAALHYALRAAGAPYRHPFGPDALDVRSEPDLILVGETVRISATFDDGRQKGGTYDASGPVPAVQNIASARVWVGEVPWQTGSAGLPMQPSDGAFNAVREAAHIDFDSTGLASGRHLALVQGRDAAGNDGPPAGVFVDVFAPAQVFTLAGRVLDIGAQTPLAATLSAGGYNAHSDPADGSYQRRLPVGSVEVELRAPGYEPLRVAGINGAGGQVVQRDFEMFRYCERLADPVDIGGDTPFSAQAPWTRRANVGVDGGAAWLQSTSGNYGNNLNISLTSPALDLSADESVVLGFDQRCDTETGYDYGIVEVNAGSGWTEVLRCSGETAWRRVELPLPELAGSATAQVRFRFTSDVSVNRSGWALDNIALHVGGAACRAEQAPMIDVFRDGFEAADGLRR